MKLSDFKYPFPRNLVAKYPAKPRDSARLMVLRRSDESIEERKFSDIVEYFKKGDCLIVNDTKVFPARLIGRKEKTNAKIEVFLLRQLNVEENIWDVIVDPARKVRIGNKIYFDDGKSGVKLSTIQHHADAQCDLITKEIDRKSTRLNSRHIQKSRMPSSA